MTSIEAHRQMQHPRYREEMIITCGSVCINCGSKRRIEYHHIVPLVNGGNHTFSNIVPLCEKCHMAAHDKKWKKNCNPKGRPRVIEYETALPIIERYYAKEVGSKEACQLIGELTGREGYSLTKGIWEEFRKRYMKENKIRYFFNDIDIKAAQGEKTKKFLKTIAENREKKASTKGVRGTLHKGGL